MGEIPPTRSFKTRGLVVCFIHAYLVHNRLMFGTLENDFEILWTEIAHTDAFEFTFVF